MHLSPAFQYISMCMGALVVYDYFLNIDDEVRQSYLLSGVQRHLKTGARYLTFGGERKVGVGTPYPRCHRPLLTCTLPLLVSYLFIAVRLLASEAVLTSRLDHRTAIFCSCTQ